MTSHLFITRLDVLFNSQQPCSPCTGAGVKHGGEETQGALSTLLQLTDYLGPMDFTFL